MTVHDWLAAWSQWVWPLAGNHLWQATLITFIVAIVAYSLKEGPARVRYWMWLAATINLAVPGFAITLLAGRLGLLPVLFDTTGETATPIQVFYQVTAPISQSFEVSSTGIISSKSHNELFCVLSLAWVIGIVFFASLWVRNRVRFARALKAGYRVFAGKEFEILKRVESWFLIKRDVGLALSPGIIEPGVWGIWRPVVILPESISSHLSEAELESVIMHELVHVLRRDNLISSLQMIVCCAFWFHPFCWLIDRRLLVERERACDERVIELGGRSEVYAASLLKVLRFCLGMKMAGVSAASGSNLRRRIEQIMANSERRSLSLSQRIFVGIIAAAVISLSITAGILTANRVEAQNRVKQGRTAPTGGVAGGVPGGVEGGVPGGVEGGVPGGVEGGVPGGVEGGVPGGVPGLEPGLFQRDAIYEKLKAAPEISLRYDVSNDAPLLISEAIIKAIKLDEPAGHYAVRPQLRLTNRTDRKISGFALEIVDATGEVGIHMEMANPVIEGNAMYLSGKNSITFCSLSGSPDSWVVKVSGVIYKGGGKWGDVPPPPPPPPPPPAGAGPVGDGQIQRARLLNRVYPSYTEQARANKVSGQVKLEILVGADGKVKDARIIEGLPDGLNEEALRAAYKMRFRPTMKDGAPEESWLSISIEFSLR